MRSVRHEQRGCTVKMLPCAVPVSDRMITLKCKLGDLFHVVDRRDKILTVGQHFFDTVQDLQAIFFLPRMSQGLGSPCGSESAFVTVKYLGGIAPFRIRSSTSCECVISL